VQYRKGIQLQTGADYTCAILQRNTVANWSRLYLCNIAKEYSCKLEQTILVQYCKGIQLQTGADYTSAILQRNTVANWSRLYLCNIAFFPRLVNRQNVRIINEVVGKQFRNCREVNLFEGRWYFGLFGQPALDHGTATVYMLSSLQIRKAVCLHD